MIQEPIKYIDVMRLGFAKSNPPFDPVYFDEYGYNYAIFELSLTENINIEWEHSSRHCTAYRSDVDGFILSTMPIINLEHLKTIINFYTNKNELNN